MYSRKLIRYFYKYNLLCKYNIKFHTTKLSDVELPNVSEYTITDSVSGNKIENIGEK